MKNIITFNMERGFVSKAQIEKVLSFLAEDGSAATFFVNGIEAEKNPRIVKLIHNNGHEIASHGYDGTPVYKQTHAEFREDIGKTITLLEDITGEYLYGYRAPGWTITETSAWALPYLKNQGFLYDSSLYPQKHPGYGIMKGPRLPCLININRDGSEKFLEVPPSSLNFFDYRFGFSAGMLRQCPRFLLLNQISSISSTGNPVICYLEPQELDTCRKILKWYLMQEATLTIKDYFAGKGFFNNAV